jgi:hypothetical protein
MFFSGAGVSEKFLSDLQDKVNKNRDSINKYEIARTILVQLNDVGDIALRERREILKRVVEFDDFSRCWPNDQIEAIGLVAKVRELVNKKDYFTTLQQIHQSTIEEENKKRQKEEEERIKNLEQKRQIRQKLKSDLISLSDEKNPQKRGKQLEGILNHLFESEGILVRESFTIKGENNEGVIQQIDGAIEVNTELYLVEMKWWKEPLSPKDVSQHIMRIYNRIDVRGIFISASGYTNAAIIDVQKVLNQKIIALFTLKELILLLEDDSTFESLLKSKVKSIQLEGKLIYD